MEKPGRNGLVKKERIGFKEPPFWVKK